MSTQRTFILHPIHSGLGSRVGGAYFSNRDEREQSFVRAVFLFDTQNCVVCRTQFGARTIQCGYPRLAFALRRVFWAGQLGHMRMNEHHQFAARDELLRHKCVLGLRGRVLGPYWAAG